jgi:hypothetical protein
MSIMPAPVVAWTREPTLTGPFGRAWRWDFGPDAERVDAARFAATLGSWLVHQPASHPWWPWYVVHGVHLRGGDGLPDPYLQRPGMAYEYMVMALDPRHPIPEPVGMPDGRLKTLRPVDQVHQIGELLRGDEAAVEILDLIVRAIVDGNLVCDQDHRASWAATLHSTWAHFAEGVH